MNLLNSPEINGETNTTKTLTPTKTSDQESTEPAKVQMATTTEQDSTSVIPRNSAGELTERRETEQGTAEADREGAIQPNSAEGSEEEAFQPNSAEGSEDETDDDGHHHQHNMERDPDDDPDNDRVVQPMTKINNRPHVLFADLRKTLGSPLREETKCPICDEKIKPYHRTLTHIPCSWSFHRGCLEEWFLTNPGEVTQCPIDRKPVQLKSLSKNRSRFLTTTERTIQEAWPRCDCHLWPNLMFDPAEAQHRNHFFLSALADDTTPATRMGAIVVAHLIQCARFGLFFNSPGFDGLMGIWHDLFFRKASAQQTNGGKTFFDMIIVPGIPTYLDCAMVKIAAVERFIQLRSMSIQLPELGEAMGEAQVTEFVEARDEAIREIIGGAKAWEMSLQAVEARRAEYILKSGSKSHEKGERIVMMEVVKKWTGNVRPWWTYG